MTLLLAFLLWLPKAALGFGLAHGLWNETRRAALAFKLALALPLGAGISSLIFFVWLGLGLPPKLYPPLEALVAFLLIFLLTRNWKFFLPARPNAPAARGLVLSAGFFAFSLGIFLRDALRFPHGYEDAWFIWNMAARFLYRPPDWTLRFRTQSALWHPDYPLLLPLNVAQGWFWLGESTRVPLALAAWFTFSLAGMLFAALILAGRRANAVLALSLLLLTPWLIEYGAQQMADVPLAAYFLATAALLWFYRRSPNPRLLILSGLLAGLSVWTKNEGWPFWFFGLLTCALFARRSALFFLLGSLPPLLTALAFKLFLAPANDLFGRNANLVAQLTDPARWGQILSAFGVHLSAFGGGLPLGIFWLLVGYAVLIGFSPRRLRQSAPLWLLLTAQLAVYFAIYLITPHDLAWHLRTSLDRLLMQVFPLALLAYFASLKKVDA